MKLLLRRFGAGWSDGLSLFNRGRPSSQRRGSLPPFLQSRRRRSPVDLVPCRRQMQTATHAAAKGEPSASAAAKPRWVILDRWGFPNSRGSSVNVAGADDKTAAESRTSSGRPIRVSLRAAAPPAISFICVDGASSKEDEVVADDRVYILAAYGDSVLFERNRLPQPHGPYEPRNDYFVYKAAAGQPPSLSLLPTCNIPIRQRDYHGYIDHFPSERDFSLSDTGILRCAMDEVLVAQLKVANDAPFDTAELCVLRPGHRYWELMTAVPIVHHGDGQVDDLVRWQDTNVAVPVGDRFLCWVNYDCSTFLLCDMAEQDPKLRYVPLPVKPVPPKEDEDYEDCYDEQPPWMYYRSIGAVVGANAVRFISIDKRCCCGAHVTKSSCSRSSSAFMVTMWTLALKTGEPMAWVKEGVLDCEELHQLAACEGLPRLHLMSPVAGLENPDVVCFVACKEEDDVHHEHVKLLWTLEIDMRRKTLISVAPCPTHPQRCINYGNPLPAKFHSY